MILRRLSTLALFLALLLPAPLYAGPAPQWQKKLDSVLRKAARDKGAGGQRVIIRFKQDAVDNVLKLLKGNKGTVLARHHWINGVTVKVNAKILQVLADCPWIESISNDAPLGVAQYSGGFGQSANQLRATLGLNSMSPKGANVGVAIIDSGIAPSPEFDNRISAFYDFTKGGVAAAPVDDFGHGTHVAGLIGGNGSLSGGQYQGVAPRARLIGLRVLDGQGAGYASDVIAALEFAIDHKTELGIDVINMSLGHPPLESTDTDPMVLAVEQAVAHGIVVVCSAGNFGVNPTTGQPGYAGIASPGNAVSAITVGAADTKGTASRADDTVPPYSSRGPSLGDGHAKPDLIAPGHKLVAATTPDAYLYQEYPAMRVTASGGQYLRLSGTSMAAGVTSGVAALVIEAYRHARAYDVLAAPPLSPKAVKGILEFSAVPVRNYDALTEGMGELNAIGATKLASLLAPGSSGGVYLTYPSRLVPASWIGNGPALWSQNIVWGENIVWADHVWNERTLRGANVVWSEAANIVWADADVDNIVWGECDLDNIVWSENIVAQNIVWGNADMDNIVWGEAALDNIVWSEADVDNIVWGEAAFDNIVWGENLVWGESVNVVWGEDIVWGENIVLGENVVWGENVLWSDDVAPTTTTVPSGSVK
jgi:serine protease AprX